MTTSLLPLFRLAQDAEPPIGSPAEEVSDGALRLWESFLESIPRLGVAATFVLAGWLLAERPLRDERFGNAL